MNRRKDEIKQEEMNSKGKSKSQFRTQRPPLPKNNSKQEKDNRIIGNMRKKRNMGEYNTDNDAEKRQSRIPRLTKANEEKISVPKKYTPDSEYQISSASKVETKNANRRSQSFLTNKGNNKNDRNFNDLRNPRKIGGSASKAMPNNSIGSRRSVNYKPYTLREYKNRVESEEDPFYYKSRGGLGPNIGGEEWMKEHEKRERIKNFSNRIKNINLGMAGDSMRRTSQTSDMESMEK